MKWLMELKRDGYRIAVPDMNPLPGAEQRIYLFGKNFPTGRRSRSLEIIGTNQIAGAPHRQENVR
jgi:hypothetical protein